MNIPYIDAIYQECAYLEYRRSGRPARKRGFTFRFAGLVFAVAVAAMVGQAQAQTELAVEAFVVGGAVVVGEPVTIQMRATNVGSSVIQQTVLSSSDFTLIYYVGDIVYGCDLVVSVPEPVPPIPPRPPLFNYTWVIHELVPGEVRECRVTYPMSLHAGTEIIFLEARFPGTPGVFPMAEFSYTLLGTTPSSPRPVPSLSALGLVLLVLALLSMAGLRLDDFGAR